MTRDFDLGDVLSITTGLLVSPRHMEGIHDILDYMTGDTLFTHQLPRAMQECQEPLFNQHPELRNIVVPHFAGSAECVEVWVNTQKGFYGDVLPVAPLATGQHEFRNPIEEACDMMGAEKVVVVNVGDCG